MNVCQNQKCYKNHDGRFGSGRFCSQKCASSYSGSINIEIANKKRSESLKGRPHPLKGSKDKKHICIGCSKTFYARVSENRKYCNRKCYNATGAVIAGIESAKKRKQRSKNEKYFSILCRKAGHKVINNANIFNGWDADVVLPELKIAVLWNGKWHYEKITESHSLEQVKTRDRIKLEKICEVGYVPYLIKDMGKYNPAFVQEQFQIFLVWVDQVIHQVS